MSFSITYKPFFEVNIPHLYFLNKGVDVFQQMDEDEKKKQLDTYNVSDFFQIVPTTQTLRKLNGHGLSINLNYCGFIVFTKVSEENDRLPFIPLDDDQSFTFLLKLNNPLFYNYTNLNLENTGKLFYFSNRRLSIESNTFPLINLYGENSIIDESYILTDEAQAEELKNLTPTEKEQLFGLVRIFVKGDESSHDILVEEEFADENDETIIQNVIPDPPRSFETVFDNRKTTWRYLFKSGQVVSGLDDVEIENGDASVLVSKDLQPLTSKGFVSVKLNGRELPNPGVNMIKPDIVNDKIFSEVYM